MPPATLCPCLAMPIALRYGSRRAGDLERFSIARTNPFSDERQHNAEHPRRLSPHRRLHRDLGGDLGSLARHAVRRRLPVARPGEAVGLRVRLQRVRRCAHEVRHPLLSRLAAVHHLRSRGGVPVSVGGGVQAGRRAGLLVDDGLPGCAHRRLRLRMEERERWNGSDFPAPGRHAGAAEGHHPSRRARLAAGPLDRALFPCGLGRAGRPRLRRHLGRRSRHLGAHRLADVDDVRARLLRRSR